MQPNDLQLRKQVVGGVPRAPSCDETQSERPSPDGSNPRPEPSLYTSAKQRALWIPILISKGLMVLMAVWGCLQTFNQAQFEDAFEHWPQEDAPTLSSHFSTWDGAHYLMLSSNGYREGSRSCAFYPLWPAAIRAGGLLMQQNWLIAAMVLANGLSLLALGLFYLLVRQSCGKETAGDALILLLAFPGALFFSFPYTESLYLVFVMVFFHCLQWEKYFWAWVVGFLMPLTKAIGVLMVIPWAWHLWERRKSQKQWMLLSAPLLGYAAYFGLMQLNTGSMFEGFAAQRD